MKKTPAKKHKLLIGTALVSMAVFSTQKAYAGCTGGAGVYTCSGASTLQIILDNDVNISTTAGFSINEASNPGLTVIGDGALQYNDTNGSSITAAGGPAINMTASADTANPGSITINTTTGATLLGQSHGVLLTNNGTGDISLTLGANATGTIGYGTHIDNNGAATNITIGSGVTVAGELAGLAINHGGSAAGTLDLQGTLEGTGLFNDALVFNNLANDMDVTLGTGSRIIGNTLDAGLLNGYSKFTVADDFTTEGNFAVSSFAIDSGKTLTISKGNNVTINTMPASSGSTIEFEVQDTSNYSSISVLNGALDLTGMTVKAKVTGSGLASGDMFLVGDGMMGASLVAGPGATRTSITDNSALWDFNIVDGTDTDVATYATNNLFLTTDDSDLWMVASSVAANFASSNTVTGSTVGTTLDAIAGGAATTGGLGALVSGTSTGTEAIQSFTPNTTLADISTSITGIVNDIVIGESIPAGPTFSSSFSSDEHLRIEALLPIGTVALTAPTGEAGEAGESISTSTDGPREEPVPMNGTRLETPFLGGTVVPGYGDAPKEYSTWGQAFGQKIHQGTRRGQAGYQGNIGGVAIGATTEALLKKTTTGIAVSYARAFINGEGLSDAESGIDSYGLTVTAQRDLGRGMYMGGTAGYMFNQYDTARHNISGLGGPTARGDYNGHSFNAQMDVGRVYNVSGTYVIPSVMASATRLDTQTYTETGAGGANLHVSNATFNTADIGAAVKVQRSWKDNEGNVATPAVQFGYRYDVVGDAVDIDSSFIGGGPAFSSQGVDPARNTFNLGLTMRYETTGNLDIDAGYNLQTKQDYIAHGASLRATLHF